MPGEEKYQGLSFLGRMKWANGQEYDVEVSWRFSFTLKVRLECRVLRSQRKVEIIRVFHRFVTTVVPYIPAGF